ncbi:hypothetical protein [Aurantiacibacter rhizosphaerae]|uniref:Uncharacterized protein n=1 Tax=Aurantiacibacter rhizosphaerae TaxID=2691582 RepID=A0A844XBE3_9SPHN|nr:hypothetical protein [Aurantiacibacter rhizosphaerae]MWV27296.1 hypothetical protein [Aurantiacibacter rhizosphaerae]
MNAAPSNKRGWPLLSLAIVLGSWVLLRAAFWETPFSSAIMATADKDRPLQAAAPTQVAAPAQNSPASTRVPDTVPAPLPHRPVYEPIERPDFEFIPADNRPPRTAAGRAGLLAADRIIAHSLLLAAAYGNAGGDGSQKSRTASPGPGVGPVATGVFNAPEAARGFAQGSRASRWSMDAWALWRDDTTTPLTSGRPSYGRSQAGAILRYRILPSSDHAPQLHLRATRALAGVRETDVALGASARPLPAVPIRLAAEARVSETDRGRELRGAAYAVTELPPVALPAGFTGEAYLQGGYVTGDFATPFADGQARVTRKLAGTDDFRLMAGGAAWGGAQDDAQRLDIGPSAGLHFRVGRARGRIAADYRFRIAGNAEPASGPALTLTAGF